MNDKTNNLTDQVNVTIHATALPGKSASYAKVKRNTAYVGNIIDKVLEKEKNLTRETLLYAAGAFRNGITDLLKIGKSVDVLELGTLYIKPVSGMEKSNPSITEIPELTLAFTPSELALSSIKDVVIGSNVTESKLPVIEKLFDVHTASTSDVLTSGHSAKIYGKRLKIAGNEDKDDFGVFFASCDENGKYEDEYSKWIRISPSSIIDNSSSCLMFELPESVAQGKYRIIVQTAYGSGTRVNKTVRKTVYANIVTVA